MRSIDLRAVFTGIMQKFQASPQLRAAVSGMYAYQPPANAAFPYIVVTVQGNTPWDTLSEGPSGEGLIIQFSVFSKKFPDIGECFHIVKLLTAAYDEADIPMTGYTALRMQRQGSIYPIGHPIEGIFHAPVRYRLVIQAA